MTTAIPLKKLFRAAAFTSVIVSVLAIANIAVIHSLPIEGIVKGTLHYALFIFTIWTENILLTLAAARFNNRSIIYIKYILSYFACFLLIAVMSHIFQAITGRHDVEFVLRHNPAAVLGGGRRFISFVLAFALNTITLIIQDLVLLRDKKAQVELENATLKLKNAEVVNQQLKQQVHPHFLFNSLNTLKILIKKEPDKAEEYLLLLSEFLRHAIDTNLPNIISVQDEINLCKTYLEMQSMRFGEALKYRIDVPAPVQSAAYIPPFSLLPLLENAIKHNILTPALPLTITVTYSNNGITVSNNKQFKNIAEISSGVGLKNLTERYKILSGDPVAINNSSDIFSVSLKLFYGEDRDHRG